MQPNFSLEVAKMRPELFRIKMYDVIAGDFAYMNCAQMDLDHFFVNPDLYRVEVRPDAPFS